MGLTHPRSTKAAAGPSRRPQRTVLLVATLLAGALMAGVAIVWQYGLEAPQSQRGEAVRRRANRQRHVHGGQLGRGAAAVARTPGEPSSWCYAWPPGQRSIYSVTQQSRIAMHVPAANGAGSHTSRETVLRVTGDLHQVVYQRGAEAVMLAVSLMKPVITLRGDTPGQTSAELDQLRADLRQPIFVGVRLNRKVDRFYYHRNVNPLAATVLKSLFFASQIVLPGCDESFDSSAAEARGVLTWKATEDNTTGQYVARYEAQPDTRQVDIYKQKQRFLAVHVSGQISGIAGSASSAEVRPGTYTLARYSPTAELLTYVEDVDVVRVRSLGVIVDASVETRLELIDQADERVDAYADAEELIRKLGLQSSSTVDGRLSPGQRRALWERTVGKSTSEQLLGQVAALDASSPGATRHELFRKLAAHYNLHPQELGDLADAILSQRQTDPSYAEKISLLSGVFTSVQDAAAERTVLGLIDAARHRPQVMSQAIGALGDLPVASGEAVKTLRQLHETGARPETRGQALLALGSLAHRAGREVPEVRAEATEYLMQQLDSAGDLAQRQERLAALGNAGAGEAFTAVARELESTQPQRRAAAIYELRRLPGDHVDETLRRFVRDETDISALEEGLKALRYRQSVENLQAAIDVFNEAQSDRIRTAALQAAADLGHSDRDRAMGFLEEVQSRAETYSRPVQQLVRDLSLAL